MPLASQLGTKDESVVGTRVTPDRFFEYASESVKLETGRTRSNGIRSGRRVAGTRFQPYVIGAAGGIELDVFSVGWGTWLKRMLGAVATAAGADEDTYVHTGSLANLCGTSFTMQVNRPFGACGGTDQAFTWGGGKVAKWTLSCEKEGNLTFSADLVFMNEVTATALASASYPPEETETLAWLFGFLTVAGSPIDVTKWTVSGDNKLKTDRLYLGAGARKEPVQDDLVEITAEFECDFDDLSHYNRFRAETAAGALCAFTAGAGAPTLIGATLRPLLEISLPALRIDDAGANVAGTSMLTQTVKGMALAPAEGGTDAIEIAYTTTDATP